MSGLGIDMGGSATRWVLVDASGLEIARGNAPGATGLLYDTPRRDAFSAALDVVRSALPHAPARAHLGITGAGFGRDPAITALASSALALDPAQVSHENDMELAFRAAFGAGSGHLVLAGTGSVGMGRNDGAPVIVGGRGVMIDDRGSASWIALRALTALYRRIDATGRPDGAEVLADYLWQGVGGSDWDSVRALVYGGDRGRIGLLARSVADAARAGCGTARVILTDAGNELAALAEALHARTGPAPLVLSGGVLALHPVITETITASLADRAPAFRDLDAAHAAAEHALSHPQDPA